VTARSVSEETRAKMSAAHLGKKLNANQIAALGKSNKERIWTSEMRAKTSAALIGRQLSVETRAKMSEARRGQPHPRRGYPIPMDVRAKISASHLGVAFSEEHKQAMAASEVGNRRAKDAPVKGECSYCGAPAQTYDHPIPRGRPGSDPDDVVPACYACNASKSNRTPDEWLARGLYQR